MKLSLPHRLALAVILAASAIAVAGCSSNSTIPPNWYDSAFTKDAGLSTSDGLGTAPTADPNNR